MFKLELWILMLYEQETVEPNDSYRLGLYVKLWGRWVGAGSNEREVELV